MRTEKELRQKLSEVIAKNDENENKDTGWSGQKATELRAKIEVLFWALNP